MPSDRQSSPSFLACWARARKRILLSFSRRLTVQVPFGSRFILDITVREAEPSFAALEQRTDPEKTGASPERRFNMEPPPNFAAMTAEARRPASA
jgi:hypothetical protein